MPKNVKEKQLQQKIVVWFSQKFPEYRGLLFMVNNDTISEYDTFGRIAKRNPFLKPMQDKIQFANKHAFAASKLGLGMVPGVSDLILINPVNGRVSGIELKAPDSRHAIIHLRQQIEWGRTVYNAGGSYIMSCDEKAIKDFILNDKKGMLFPLEILTSTKKTFKFFLSLQ